MGDRTAVRASPAHGNQHQQADVILDKASEEVQSLAIVDYKTSTDLQTATAYEFQLAVYANAGRREGFNVRAA